MKKTFALLFAAISGLYLLLMGPMIGPFDPIPILDEAVALLIFTKAMGVLGVDLGRWLPFLGRKGAKGANPSGPVVDV